jgi:hypothetical protein
MNKIKEDYVSFEVAKLLKEKGFDEPCRSLYEEKILCVNTVCDYFNSELSSYVCAPTHQMAMKWLREVHNIFIQIELYNKNGDYCFEVFKNTHRMIVEKNEVYNTYEEACEAALKHCLINLIK